MLASFQEWKQPENISLFQTCNILGLGGLFYLFSNYLQALFKITKFIRTWCKEKKQT